MTAETHHQRTTKLLLKPPLTVLDQSIITERPYDIWCLNNIAFFKTSKYNITHNLTFNMYHMLLTYKGRTLDDIDYFTVITRLDL